MADSSKPSIDASFSVVPTVAGTAGQSHRRLRSLFYRSLTPLALCRKSSNPVFRSPGCERALERRRGEKVGVAQIPSCIGCSPDSWDSRTPAASPADRADSHVLPGELADGAHFPGRIENLHRIGNSLLRGRAIDLTAVRRPGNVAEPDVHDASWEGHEGSVGAGTSNS